MEILTTTQVVERLLRSAACSKIGPSAWSSYLAAAFDDASAPWYRLWPEFAPQGFYHRMVPLHYAEQRAGWDAPVAHFEGPSANQPWWDILLLPDEPGAVVVAGGFAGEGISGEVAGDHRVFWFRRRGLAHPGLWDAEILPGQGSLSPSDMRQLLTHGPIAGSYRQAA